MSDSNHTVAASVPRPRRVPVASSRLLDASNTAAPTLSSHKQAIEAHRQAEDLTDHHDQDASTIPSQISTASTLPDARGSSPGTDRPGGPGHATDPTDSDSEPVEIPKKRKRPQVEISDSDSDTPVEVKKAAVGSDEFLTDINVQSVSEAPKVSFKDRSRDVDQFFSPAYKISDKNHRNCRICSKKTPQHPVTLVAELTTLRRHMQSHHKGAYQTWADKNNFVSMLPKDAEQRRKQEAAKTQRRLDPHLVEKPQKERVVPYSDSLFRNTAIEWLVSTDQPIQALQHESFQNLIHVAARASATTGIKIPNRRQTREAIISQFEQQMIALRTRLTGDTVKGKVSLTCDAWQASTTDGYFAVTGSWVQEGPGKWQIHTALLGFTQLNNAHNGTRLGQALFKIVSRIGIAHKIGHVTCDNASNNNTMLVEFAKHIRADSNKVFNPTTNRIRCLAHIINLATQALISTHSKSRHYNPGEPDADLAVDRGLDRDEVGLIRSICVKARSSAKRKQLFADIQKRGGVTTPLQLLLDMPVRWSSTYVMTSRAELNRKFVDTFVYEMGREENDLAKRQKIDRLQLLKEEWERLGLFNDLLAHADNAQHAFSSDQGTTLHLALPALEALHKAWSTRLKRDKYHEFTRALKAGIAKIEEYYERTILDPSQKTEHIRKYWGEQKLDEVLERAAETYKERYLEVHGNHAVPVQPQRTGKSALRRLGSLIRELSDDEPDDDDKQLNRSSPAVTGDPGDHWRKDFDGYLSSRDQLGDMTLAEWWGWNSSRYEIWASLARDFLPIMASSVSSERAFSSAGITVSKRRNRLKPDVIEALQFLKCVFRRDLLFREEPSTEYELEESNDRAAGGKLGDSGAKEYEDLEDADPPEDEGPEDYDEDEVFVQQLAGIVA